MITQEIKKSYKKDRLGTLFMAAIIGFSLIDFVKPDIPISLSNIASYIGVSLINLVMILLFTAGIIYFIRRN